jgi:hypothetical protein
MRLVRVSDPEQEIIESDIIWYHNHLRSYRNRYLLETGAANRAERKNKRGNGRCVCYSP